MWFRFFQNQFQSLISESVDGGKQSDSVPISRVTRNKPKYIQHDLAQELLTGLRLCPLKGHKWLWEGAVIHNSLKISTLERKGFYF